MLTTVHADNTYSSLQSSPTSRISYLKCQAVDQVSTINDKGLDHFNESYDWWLRFYYKEKL